MLLQYSIYKELKQKFGLSILNPCDVEETFVEDLMAIQPSNAEDFFRLFCQTHTGANPKRNMG